MKVAFFVFGVYRGRGQCGIIGSYSLGMCTWATTDLQKQGSPQTKNGGPVRLF